MINNMQRLEDGLRLTEGESGYLRNMVHIMGQSINDARGFPDGDKRGFQRDKDEGYPGRAIGIARHEANLVSTQGAFQSEWVEKGVGHGNQDVLCDIAIMAFVAGDAGEYRDSRGDKTIEQLAEIIGVQRSGEDLGISDEVAGYMIARMIGGTCDTVLEDLREGLDSDIDFIKCEGIYAETDETWADDM